MKKKIVIAAILVLVLSISLVLPMATAFADYDDIINNPNAIVEFNQLVENTYIDYTYSSSSWTNVAYNIKQNHIYYLRCKTTDNHTFYFWTTGTPDVTQTIGTGNEYVVTALNNYDRFLVRNSNQASITINNLMLIDLTQMFGSGNEPNLLQCQSLFVGNSYRYNLGSPLSINGLNSYSQGFNDAYSQEPIYYSGNIFNNNFYFQIYDRNNSYITGNYIDVFTSPTEGYSMAYFAIPAPLVYGDSCTLSSLTSGGWSIEFYFTSQQDVSTLNPTIELCYLNSGYQVLTSISKDNGLRYNTYIYDEGYHIYGYYFDGVSFDAPISFSNLYFRSEYNYTIIQPQLEVITRNASFEIQTSYDSGYSTAKSYFDSYYGVGGNGYNEIYNLGKADGVSSAGNYTFLSLISAVVDTPINAVLSMLDFNLLGINMKSFYLSLFTFCIVLFVIKLII